MTAVPREAKWCRNHSLIHRLTISLSLVILDSLKHGPESRICQRRWSCWCHILGDSCLWSCAWSREWHQKDTLEWQPVLPWLVLTYYKQSWNKGRRKINDAPEISFFFFSQEMTMMLQKISPALIYARVPGKGTRYTYLTTMFRIPRHWECTKVRSYTKISWTY